MQLKQHSDARVFEQSLLCEKTTNFVTSDYEYLPFSACHKRKTPIGRRMRLACKLLVLDCHMQKIFDRD
jgi:hypothetical protein